MTWFFILFCLAAEIPGGDFRKFTRRKSSVESDDHRSRTIYDWFSNFFFLISTLWDYSHALCIVCVCLIINNLIYFFFLFLWFAGWLWVLWIVERGSDVFNLHRTSFGRGRGILFSVHIPYTLIPISKGNHMIIYIAWHLIAIIIIII